MAPSLETALNSSLDDMISKKKGGGKGKRKANKGKGEGKKAAAAPNKVKKAPKAKSDKAPAKSGVGTAKALDMSLEDICKAETKGNKKQGGPKQQDAGAKAPAAKKLKIWGQGKRRQGGEEGKKGWGKAGGGKGKASWAKGGGKQWKQKVEVEWVWEPAPVPRGKGKGKKSWESKKWAANDDDWAPKRKKEWGGKGDSWGGREDSWGGRKGGGRGEDRYEREPPRERQRERAPRQDSWRRTESRAVDHGPRDRASDHWGPADKGHRDAPERDTGRVSGGPLRGGEFSRGAIYEAGRGRKRMQEDEAPPARAERSAVGSKRIKVKNIPRDLDQTDIKDAFEAEAGKIDEIIMRNGTAQITFFNAKDARKAVDTFDRGELNGKTIDVIFDR